MSTTTRGLKIPAGTSKTRLKRAWQSVSKDYEATLSVTAAQLDYKETHVIVGQLTGALTFNLDGVGSNFLGDQLFLHLNADGTDRVLTLGTFLSATSTTFTVPANKTLVFMFTFDGTNFNFNILKTTAAITDTVAESTPAAGVTVDGVLHKDGATTTTAINTYASATGITAFATGGQASATQLSKEFNEITTCATANDSVKLPSCSAGLNCIVKNNGATACAVFPTTGDSIDTAAANASVVLQPGELVHFRGVDNTVWETSRQVLTLDKLLTALLIMNGTPQTLTGAGAVNLTTFSTLIVTTGANALTLAAGTEGQFKFIRMKTDGGDGTLTVTNLQGGTTLTFNDAGDFVLLFYQDAKWHIIVNSGATLA